MTINRRQFLKTGAKGIALAALTGAGMTATTSSSCEEVIEQIVTKMIGKPLEKSVDTIKMGDARQPVRGMVTTMFPTCEVLEKAAQIGANLVIAHEPTFYSHLDETDWLQGDPVFEHKKQLILKNNLVVWRCHDTIHRMQPDGIVAGIEKTLGWTSQTKSVYDIQPMSVIELSRFLKDRLQAPFVRFIGSEQQICKSAVFLVGAPGGRRQMMAARHSDADVLIIGESPEWETHEYFRDARHAETGQALIIVGHIPSEQAGMEWLAAWLKPRFPDVPITCIANSNMWSMI